MESLEPRIIIIAAMARNRVLGRNNGIPWHIPSEQQLFRALTLGHPVIMGRNTWESLGRPLAGRRNIVLSRSSPPADTKAEWSPNLTEALKLAQPATKIFIIGGAQVYQQALPLADTLVLSLIDLEVEGDRHFPTFSTSDFVLVTQRLFTDTPAYTLNIYQRTSNDTPWFSRSRFNGSLEGYL